MASRKEVFLEKVMKRLYPSPAKAEIPQTTGRGGDAVTEKTAVKVRPITDIASGDGGKNRLPQKRLYTVLLPPEEYKMGAEEPAMLLEPGDINTRGHPDAEIQEDDEDEDSTELSGGGQRRRRRKRKAGAAPEGGAKDRGSQSSGDMELAVGPGAAGAVSTEGGDARKSKNRKRKAKKKRHKERLQAMGLIPSAAPVEFTYRPEEEEEECGSGAALPPNHTGDVPV